MYDEYNGVDARNKARTTTPSNSVYRDGSGGLSLWDTKKFNHREDPNTGLPVPMKEDQYFRVSTKNNVITVHYMQKRWWWRDLSLSTCDVNMGRQELVQDDILYMALFALHKWEVKLEHRKIAAERRQWEKEDAQSRRDMAKRNSRFNGNYPPKVLS